MKKTGRPRKGEHEKRSETLALRMTLAEKTVLEKQAANAGMSLASYTRKIILERHAPTSSGVDDAALITELNRLGLEFNRCAAAGLEGCDPGSLNALLAQFSEMLAKVSSAHGT